jgi:hypothetical protein
MDKKMEEEETRAHKGLKDWRGINIYSKYILLMYCLLDSKKIKQQVTYPTRLLFDLVRLFDISSFPSGVNGLIFADGLSGVNGLIFAGGLSA